MMGKDSRTQLEKSNMNSSYPKSNDDNGGSIAKLLGWGVAAAVGVVVAKQWPEVQRYLKMRKM